MTYVEVFDPGNEHQETPNPSPDNLGTPESACPNQLIDILLLRSYHRKMSIVPKVGDRLNVGLPKKPVAFIAPSTEGRIFDLWAASSV
ncbi:MAG: hypothetical protein A2Z25_22025 [Planctomycetes bacterium RBG_16_55_9]|nr:MAG: hypothetical protein A2Z25_22025 [Planctomycetes bacterium RBG_16_55_9]